MVYDKMLCSFKMAWTVSDIKLEKGPTDKAKEPDPGGSDQQNLGFKKLKNRKTDRTVGFELLYFQKYGNTKVQIQPYGQFFCFQILARIQGLTMRGVRCSVLILLQSLHTSSIQLKYNSSDCFSLILNQLAK